MQTRAITTKHTNVMAPVCSILRCPCRILSTSNGCTGCGISLLKQWVNLSLWTCQWSQVPSSMLIIYEAFGAALAWAQCLNSKLDLLNIFAMKVSMFLHSQWQRKGSEGTKVTFLFPVHLNFFQPQQGKLSLTDELHWADGFIIVYDISDRASFAFAKALLYRIRESHLAVCKK